MLRSSPIAEPVRYRAIERDFQELQHLYEAAIGEVLRSGQVVGGPWVERLEEEVAAVTCRRHCIATTSGTEALRLMLAAVGVGPGWSALVPSLTFIATASSVLAVGATPFFVDVEDHAHMDLDLLELALRDVPHPMVLVAVGLFGNGLDTDRLRMLCNRHGAVLLEDAAQSFGSVHMSCVPGGSLGLAGSFSFAPSKTVPCFGNAGALVTDDDDLASRARLLRTHGKANNRTPAIFPGSNSSLSAVLAAQLCVSLKYRKERAERRSYLASRLIERLRQNSFITVPAERPGTVHVWDKFVIRCSQRDTLAGTLLDHGIESMIHYRLPLPDEAIFNRYKVYSCDKARSWARNGLSLPMYSFLSESDIDRIANAVQMFGDSL